MNNLNKFDEIRNKVAAAKDVKQLMDIWSEDLDSRIPKEEFIKNLQREFNRKYRGNLEKCKKHLLQTINTSEYYHDQDMILEAGIELANKV